MSKECKHRRRTATTTTTTMTSIETTVQYIPPANFYVAMIDDPLVFAFPDVPNGVECQVNEGIETRTQQEKLESITVSESIQEPKSISVTGSKDEPESTPETESDPDPEV